MKDIFAGQTYGLTEVRLKRTRRQKNDTVVYNNDSNHRSYFYFGRNIVEQTRGKFSHVYICRSEITWRWYFVFNNDKGLNLRLWNNNSRNVSAGDKDTMRKFSKDIGHVEERYTLLTGENISKNSKYAVFEIFID